MNCRELFHLAIVAVCQNFLVHFFFDIQFFFAAIILLCLQFDLLVLGVYADVSMYKDWIDEIMSTKTLPEYIYSPFPKPSKDSYFNAISNERQQGNNAERPKFMTLIALLLIAVIISSHSVHIWVFVRVSLCLKKMIRMIWMRIYWGKVKSITWL